MENYIPFNVNHLKFFFDAASLGSVSKAAKKNYVSQSAISQGIKNLESALKCQLLQHRKSRFALTEKGEKVFNEAKEIMQSLFNLQHKIKTEVEEVIGKVYFGMSHSIGLVYLPGIYRSANTLYPKLALDVHFGESLQLKEWVKQKKLDFAVVVNNVPFPDVEYTTLADGYFKLYTSANGKNNSHENGILVADSNSIETRKLKKLYKETFDQELVINAVLPSWEMVIKFVDQGNMGPGFLPDFLAENLSENLVAKDYKVLKIPYEIGLIQSSDKKFPFHTVNFVELIGDCLKRNFVSH